MSTAFGRRAFIGTSAVLGTTLLLGCERTEDASSLPSPSAPASLKIADRIFAMSLPAAVGGLDPLLMTTAEQTLLCRQIFQRLVGVDPNTGAPTQTELASEWDVSDDGLRYAFTLKPNVTFHDGTACDAAAVVANVKRWIELPEKVKAVSAGTLPDYFAEVFGTETPNDGQAKKATPAPEDAAVKGRGSLASVAAQGTDTVVFTLHKPLPGLLPALAHTAFSICSPTALKDKKANSLSQELPRFPKGGKFSAFAAAPIGSGVYRYASDDTEAGLVLTHVDAADAADDESSASPSLDPSTPTEIQLRSYRTGYGRLRVLEEGKANAFSDVTPNQIRPVLQQGFRFLQRDPFSMAYLGINHEHPVLESRQVRRLIASALDTNRLAGSYFLDGTHSNRAFTPPALAVSMDNFPQPFFDRAQVPQEVEELEDLEPITLYFPTDTSRTWLPEPERTALDIANQLTEAGFTIRPVPVAWDAGYQQRILTDDKVGLYLWGITGAYRDPLNFLSPILTGPGPARGYTNDALEQLAEKLRHEDLGSSTRQDHAAQISVRLATDVACVPLCTPISAIALARQVQHYPTSPVLDELFTSIRLGT
ncbi:ABC transporter substrate-binding protein [Micrococcoides hystricis]|uniref:ABC transporter substrate-binding protein n=1 Tax=Micrococcoides hystricis TaxID=1572761 RepID=A0ABV6PBZ0_9MICC